jgi:uncharacterized protein YfcZ (UPF0381/DUF406 family)
MLDPGTITIHVADCVAIREAFADASVALKRALSTVDKLEERLVAVEAELCDVRDQLKECDQGYRDLEAARPRSGPL